MSRHREQVPIARFDGSHKMFSLNERKQIEPRVVEQANIAWFSCRACPRSDPSPKGLLCVPTKTPLRPFVNARCAVAFIMPSRVIRVSVVNEEFPDHIH